MKLNHVDMKFRGEEVEHAHEAARRLRARIRALGELPCGDDLSVVAIGVADSTLSALNVQACIFQRPIGQQDFETIAIDVRSSLSKSWIERIAARFADDVTASQRSVLVNDLAARFPGDRLLSGPQINSYLGVPVIDSSNRVVLVASVLSSSSREFYEEDEWWLRAAARVVAESLTQRSLKEKLSDLERVLAPNATNDVESILEREEQYKLSVLVIDDDPSIADLICDFLTEEGYRAEAAYDGIEAIRTFRPAEHDVVLTDVAMPHMNGWELIAAVRVRAPEIPVVLITGYSSGTWNQAYLREHGIVEVLSKPLDLNKLLSILQGLDGSKLRLSQQYTF